jgi:hypothetical protein
VTVVELPHLPGVLSADEAAQTAATIAALQLPSGMIPWFPGGHCDPWNHVETAMALSIAGHLDAAERAYGWLIDTQRPDGSWHNYYRSDGSIEEAKLDTNVCAYVAAGVWHHWLVTEDRGFVDALWPTVQRALDWVLGLQTPRGEIIWAREVDAMPWGYALLTGSSSICHSLRCGVALGQLVGDERPEWELAAVTLAEVIRNEPAAFEPKHRWAMDWYYPVLCGVVTGQDAREQLGRRWDTFIMAGLGVRCVNDEPWVTAAETAECALAHLAAGERDKATDLLTWTRAHRLADGSYSTGIVYPQRVTFPDRECSAYTAAAVLLAADALTGASAASTIFLDDPLCADIGQPVGDPRLD